MLYINDTLRINRFDENCLQLETYKDVVSKKTGISSKQWKGVGYYGSLRSALEGALRKQLFDTVDEELLLKDVISRIDAAVGYIKKLNLPAAE